MKKTKHFLFHLGLIGLFASYAPINVLAGGMCCSEFSEEHINLDADDALIQAILLNKTDIATNLIKQNCDLEFKDEEGNTALHWAAFKGLLPIINLLIKNKAKINDQNLSGQTPLMCAAFSGESKAVRVLLAYGAQLDITDNEEKTALILATEEEFESIITILENKIKQQSHKLSEFLSHDKEEGEECSICYESLNIHANYTTTNCGHAFHLECVRELYMHGQPCPMCRKEI